MDKKTQAFVSHLQNLYGLAQKDLEALILGFDDDEVERLLADANGIIDRLDADTAAVVRQVVHRIVLFETRHAERHIGGPPLTVPESTMDAIDRNFYLAFHQQNQTVRYNITETINRGFKKGMSLEDRRAFQQSVIKQGIVGLVRSDGSQLSVEATGKALVRTRVNQLQAETQIHRYKAGGVTHVEFVAGGTCNYHGEGGTCTELDGTRFPINDIPDWAQIPRHLYSNSRWLPVVSND